MGMSTISSGVNTCSLKVQDATLAHYSGFIEEEIQPIFELMLDYLHRPVAHEAFFKKYASKKFLKGMSI
jgi:Cyclin, C-terminal domain